MAQFHFDPVSYLDMVRSEVPHYDLLQAAIASAAASVPVAGPARVLDLGAGTGMTAAALLAAMGDARLTLLDESEPMLAVARANLPAASIENVVVADLSQPLPEGPFDIVTSALAIHHLDGDGKQALFRAVHAVLRAGGRFAMADVVVPPEPADAVVPLEEGYDKPDRGGRPARMVARRRLRRVVRLERARPRGLRRRPLTYSVANKYVSRCGGARRGSAPSCAAYSRAGCSIWSGFTASSFSFAGTPTAIAPRGTTMPPRTTAPAATNPPDCTTAACNTIEPVPTSAPSSIVQPSRCTRWPIVQSAPTVVSSSRVQCSTEPSCTDVRAPTTIRLWSPRSTACGHTVTPAAMTTLPMIVASG